MCNELNEVLAENLSLFKTVIAKVDDLNKRLVTALVIVSLIFSLTIFGLGWLYFCTDYDYPVPVVEQTQNNNQHVNLKGGAD